jgi:hypothetical protein
MAGMKDQLGDTFYQNRYPNVPGHVKGDTSIAAAKSVEPSATALRKKVLDYASLQHEGVTCDDVEAKLSMRHQTCSARIRELVMFGQLVDTGARRKTRSGRSARVYRATIQPTWLLLLPALPS